MLPIMHGRSGKLAFDHFAAFFAVVFLCLLNAQAGTNLPGSSSFNPFEPEAELKVCLITAAQPNHPEATNELSLLTFTYDLNLSTQGFEVTIMVEDPTSFDGADLPFPADSTAEYYSAMLDQFPIGRGDFFSFDWLVSSSLISDQRVSNKLVTAGLSPMLSVTGFASIPTFVEQNGNIVLSMNGPYHRQISLKAKRSNPSPFSAVTFSSRYALIKWDNKDRIFVNCLNEQVGSVEFASIPLYQSCSKNTNNICVHSSGDSGWSLFVLLERAGNLG